MELRAGIPGVAGRLGVPAKTISFWKRAVFFARKRGNFIWVFFSPFGGVFFLLGGVFALFWGVFVLSPPLFLFSARQRDFLGGVNF